MKFKQILMGMFLMGMFLAGMAQPPGDRMERVEAFKIAFLTRELELTPEEAKQFWPVYDNFQEEKKELRKQVVLDRVEARLNFEDMSDKEVEQALNGFIDSKQAELDLTRKYITEFQKVIPVRKVAKLFRAEAQFKNKLVQELQNNRRGDAGGGVGGGAGVRPGGGRRMPRR